MKRSSIGGMAAGMALGLAAMTAYGMMSRASRRRLRAFAMRSGRKLAEAADGLFGR